jgi:hypothetical protein
MEKGGGLCPPPFGGGSTALRRGGDRPTGRPAVVVVAPPRCRRRPLPVPLPSPPPPPLPQIKIKKEYGDEGGKLGGRGGRKYKNRKIENNSNGLTGNVTGLNVFRRVQTG